jgi:hypothetical protein
MMSGGLLPVHRVVRPDIQQHDLVLGGAQDQHDAV